MKLNDVIKVFEFSIEKILKKHGIGKCFFKYVGTLVDAELTAE